MRKHLFKIIGIVIFAYILYIIDVSNLVSVFTKTRIDYIFIVLVLAIPLVLIKSWRWQYLLKMQGIDYSLKNAFMTYWSGIYMGTITPGRVGEFARAFYLRQDKRINISRAFSSVIGDRLLDLCVLIIFSFMGLIYFELIRSVHLSVMLILILAAMYLVFVNKRIRNNALNYIKSIPFLEKYEERIETYCNNFYGAMDDFKSIRIVIPIAVSFVAYALFFFQCYLMALALGINISFINIIFCISISNIISFIPISISGIGTRDATLIYLFSILGLNQELAVSYSILILVCMYVSVMMGGSIAYWRKPLKIRMVP